MDKKGSVVKKKKTIDGSEDKTITKVAHSKHKSYTVSQTLLLIILMAVFSFTLFCTFYYINQYMENRYNYAKEAELIEIKNSKTKSMITNSAPFESVIDDTLTDDVVIYSYSNAEIYNMEENENEGVLIIDVTYSLLQNEFTFNAVPTIDSDVIVKFSYSYDNENWTDINSVLTTSTTSLNTIMSNYYDVSGIEDTINVMRNYELKCKPGETKKIYFKSETRIKNNGSTVGKTLKGNFKIEYKESA